MAGPYYNVATGKPMYHTVSGTNRAVWDCCCVTPDIFNSSPNATPSGEPFALTVAWFSGGSSIAAGDYVITYKKGAMKYASALNWQLALSDQNGDFHYMATYNGGSNRVQAPGGYTAYTTQALLEAGEAGKYITITHTSGKIGVYLRDINKNNGSEFYNNVAGSPNPTYCIRTVSPAP